MKSRCCLCTSSNNFRMAEPIFMKLSMFNMAPESISTAYFINPSHQSLCLYVYLFVVARQLFGKHVTAEMNTRNNIIIVGRDVFCGVRVVSKKVADWLFPGLVVVYKARCGKFNGVCIR
jgi:hypothetical protein